MQPSFYNLNFLHRENARVLYSLYILHISYSMISRNHLLNIICIKLESLKLFILLLLNQLFHLINIRTKSRQGENLKGPYVINI